MVRTVQTLLHSQLACNEMQASVWRTEKWSTEKRQAYRVEHGSLRDKSTEGLPQHVQLLLNPAGCSYPVGDGQGVAQTPSTGLRHPSFNHCHRKLSANEQFFVGAKTVVSLLRTTQIKMGVSFIAASKVYTSADKTTIV